MKDSDYDFKRWKTNDYEFKYMKNNDYEFKTWKTMTMNLNIWKTMNSRNERQHTRWTEAVAKVSVTCTAGSFLVGQITGTTITRGGNAPVITAMHCFAIRDMQTYDLRAGVIIINFKQCSFMLKTIDKLATKKEYRFRF